MFDIKSISVISIVCMSVLGATAEVYRAIKLTIHAICKTKLEFEKSHPKEFNTKDAYYFFPDSLASPALTQLTSILSATVARFHGISESTDINSIGKIT